MGCMMPLMFLCVMSSVVLNDGAKLLLMPAQHYSHINFYTEAAKSLTQAGHDVTIMCSDEFASKVTMKGMKVVSFSHSPEANPRAIGAKHASSFLTGNSSIFALVTSMSEVLGTLCREVFENKELMEQIRKGGWDLTINESAPFAFCFYVINYKFDIPYISMGPWQNAWGAGVSNIPAHGPTSFLPYHGRLTFPQRVMSGIFTVVESLFQYNIIVSDDFIREYAPEKPATTFRALVQGSQLNLITQEINCFAFPRVSAPNYRFIGSLSGSAPANALDEKFSKIVEKADAGVIVIGFGSLFDMRKSLTPYIGHLLEALGRMPQTAILQFTKEELKGQIIPKNVHVTSWLPQVDLLGHVKTKLFISHGGLNSHLEATYHAVPILTLPYQLEQKGNGLRARAKRQGDVLDWTTTNADELYNTMTELINNPTYKANIQHCSDILKDLPNARDELVFWVNHILKFSGAHLRPPSADMGTLEFFMIDVILFVSTLGFFIIALLIKCCKSIYRVCKSKMNVKKIKSS